MDINELQEVFESVLARHPPESSAGHAIMFVNQVLTAKSDEEKAQALCLLLDLLATSKSRLAFYMAKLWAFTCTDAGYQSFEAFADRQEQSE
jgi:hypothetical protein